MSTYFVFYVVSVLEIVLEVRVCLFRNPISQVNWTITRTLKVQREKKRNLFLLVEKDLGMGDTRKYGGGAKVRKICEQNQYENVTQTHHFVQ